MKYQNVYLIRDTLKNLIREQSESFSYIRIKKSLIELEDSIFGFTMKKDYTTFHEGEMSPIYSHHTDKDDVFLLFKFEVDAMGNKYSRVVWNMEEALGWIGGLLQIIILIQAAAIQPFIKDSLVYEIA